MHSFHLAHVPLRTAARALVSAPEASGLRHVEFMATMRLGAPVVSPDRMRMRHVAVFCAWEDERSLDAWLRHDDVGRRLATGWHVRLDYVRRWGAVVGLDDLPEVARRSDPSAPAVAFTLARMRATQVPRFVRWGRPVERLVRDHPAVGFATAAIRPPRTVATFSAWRSTREMTDMVFGRSGVDAPRRHADAMVERERRDFHHEFTTLRFRPVSEHGGWDGRTGLVPG